MNYRCFRFLGLFFKKKKRKEKTQVITVHSTICKNLRAGFRKKKKHKVKGAQGGGRRRKKKVSQ